MNSSLRLMQEIVLAARDPEQLQFRVGALPDRRARWRPSRVRRRRAEAPHPREPIGVLQPDAQRLPAPMLKPTMRPAPGLRRHPVVRLDERHHVLEQVALERGRLSRAPPAPPMAAWPSIITTTMGLARPWAMSCPGSNAPCRARSTWPGCRPSRAAGRGSDTAGPGVLVVAGRGVDRPSRADDRGTWRRRCAHGARRAGTSWKSWRAAAARADAECSCAARASV